MALFIGESDGARVIQVGLGVSDVTSGGTTDVLVDLTSHDQYPGGPGGVVIFRGIVVAFRHDAGYHVGVTPIVDGVSQSEQTFSAPAPDVTSDGLVTIQAPFSRRGTRVAARVRQLAADGLFEIGDVAALYVVLRTSP